jgi:hypothetical protein
MVLEYIPRTFPLLDHLRRNGIEGWGSRVYLAMPPKAPEQAEIDLFSHELVDVSQTKITELLDHHDSVEKRRKNNISRVQSLADKGNWSQFEEWFFTYLENYEYSEVAYIQKWVKYWAKIYEMASQKTLMPVLLEHKDEISADDIARAKEFPLEELYVGQLRHVFGRLLGICPFHDEKSPSFTIFTDDNHYYCFGCHAHGDAIDYYSKTKHVSMVEAVKVLNG